jgi:hypothetical protein
MDEFTHSLYYVDYADILHNENYVLTTSGKIPDIEGYEPKVDAAFLFDEKTLITHLTYGLGNQKNYYAIWHKFCMKYGMNLYLNDLFFDGHFGVVHFNGMEIQRLTIKNIEPFMFSNIFSYRLRQRIRITPHRVNNIQPVYTNAKWHDIGLKEAYLITCDDPYLNRITGVHELKIPSLWAVNIDGVEDFVVNRIHGKIPFICHCHLQRYGFEEKNYWETYYAFPAFHKDDTRNIQISEAMRTHDAVSIHIRRGADWLFVWGSPALLPEIYISGVKYVWEDKTFSAYRNKHLYVFTDDMEFVRDHSTEYGLDIAGRHITYVDWNYHYNSICDLHLMGLSKIMILGNHSSFSHTAAYISKNVEYVVNTTLDGCSVIWKREEF